MDAPTLVDRLTAVVSSDPRVNVPVAELARTLAVMPRHLDDAIAEAVAGGWLESWMSPRAGRCVVLSARVAAGLGLVMSDTGQTWHAAEKPRRREGTRNAPRSREIPATDYFGDSAPFANMPAKETNLDRRDDATPHYFLGTIGGWPIPSNPDGSCGACSDRKLAPGVFCLACNRPMGSLAGRARAKVKRAEDRKAQRLADNRAGQHAEAEARRIAKARKRAGLQDAARILAPSGA